MTGKLIYSSSFLLFDICWYLYVKFGEMFECIINISETYQLIVSNINDNTSDAVFIVIGLDVLVEWCESCEWCDNIGDEGGLGSGISWWSNWCTFSLQDEGVKECFLSSFHT